jgi:sterol desaturase/sphingolipid hydroxylase (fatty acid hydroxylase superfamily)
LEITMPTPLALLLDPISLAFFGTYLALLLWEALRPARPLPRVAGWYARGGLATLAYFLISSYLPLWLSPYLGPLQIADFSGLGTWWGGLVALLAYEVMGYLWHRVFLHGTNFGFRVFHQWHHSAERLDVSSALWFSPLDMVGWTVVPTVALAILGVTPGATVVFILASTFLAIFQHANIRTPLWLGYIIQRPENHAQHHARGLHAGNYADLPIVDRLFGTFINAASFPQHTGYADGASSRVADMLLCKDVTNVAKQTSSPALLQGLAK